MFWKKITLDGFIPFTHVGNKHVEIEFDASCTAILGSNGCGKSSLLRIMNVVNPPVRTDFLKDGRIEMVLDHDGHIFTLTSDFKNSSAPHSFKKDGEELNLSGTSDTQRDLALEHFGLTSLVNDLISGNIHICNMQKAVRKQLFSATYPSDLSFVLEYHKKVCSQIRTLANQMKLMQGREGSLIASLMDKAELERLSNWRNSAQELVTRIDRINLLLSNEITQLEGHEVMSRPFDHQAASRVIDDIRGYIKEYRDNLLDYTQGRQYGDIVDVDNMRVSFGQYKQHFQSLEDQKRKEESSLQTITDEITKLERVKGTSALDKKEEILNELRLITEEMESLKSSSSWQDAPAIQESTMSIMPAIMEQIAPLLASIHPYCGSLVGGEEIAKMQAEIDRLTSTISVFEAEKVDLVPRLTHARSHRDMLTQNSYPKDCERVCGLRATLEASLRDVDMRIHSLENRLNCINESIARTVTDLDKLRSKLRDITPALPIMKALHDKLSENYLLDLAIGEESFIDCLNNRSTEIINRINKGMESSKVYYRYKDLYNKSVNIKNTLSMMESDESVKLSADLIDEMIRDKQTKIDAGIAELKRLDDEQHATSKKICDLGNMIHIMKSMDNAIVNASNSLSVQLITARIDFDKSIMREHDNVRNAVASKLRDIEHTLEEQKRITDVLETEIRPTLETLRKQKADWELVESGLSPSGGLPCLYLIRFMNRLISRTNALISEIWYNDMELAYIEEDEDLDFTMKVIFNNSTSAKDISLCSNGQKAVIDLAFMLALCQERGYLDHYSIKLDEVDAALTPDHRAKLTELISNLLDEGVIKQMFLVNQFAVQTGISRCDNVVLSPDGVVVPDVYNEHAIIS